MGKYCLGIERMAIETATSSSGTPRYTHKRPMEETGYGFPSVGTGGNRFVGEEDNLSNPSTVETGLPEHEFQLAVAFASRIEESCRAGQLEIAFAKVREAFGGRWSKCQSRGRQECAASFACLKASMQKKTDEYLAKKGRVLGFILSDANLSPGGGPTSSFKRTCAIYTLLNSAYNPSVTESLLKFKTVELLQTLVFLPYDVDKDHTVPSTSWLYQFLTPSVMKAVNGKDEGETILRKDTLTKIPSIGKMTACAIIAMCQHTQASQSQIKRFQFVTPGGLECLLRIVSEEAHDIAIRNEALNTIKRYSLEDCLRFKSRCTFKKTPSNQLLDLFRIVKAEKVALQKERKEKQKMYCQARIDKDDHRLGVGERLNAAAIHAKVEIFESIDVLSLPETPSNVLLPCLNTETPEFVLPAQMEQKVQSLEDMEKKMREGILRTARANAASAIANSKKIELEQRLSRPLKSWRERQKEIDLRDLATLAADSRHRIAQVAEANQTTLDMLKKIVNVNCAEALDQSNEFTTNHLRKEIEKAQLRFVHCTKAKEAASLLLLCTQDEINSLNAKATKRKEEARKDISEDKMSLDTELKLWADEARNARQLIAENEVLVDTFIAENESNGTMPKALKDKLHEIKEGVMKEAAVQLKRTEAKVELLQPLLRKAEKKYQEIHSRNLLSFLTTEEVIMYYTVKDNETYASMMGQATQHAVDDSKAVLDARQYMSKLFSRSDHASEEIKYLLETIIRKLGFARQAMLLANNAYGAMRHFQAAKLVRISKERHADAPTDTTGLFMSHKLEVKTVQTEADMKIYAIRSVVDAIKMQIALWSSMPTVYDGNETFDAIKSDQLASLRDQQIAAQAALSLAEIIGKYKAALHRCKMAKEIIAYDKAQHSAAGRSGYEPDKNNFEKAESDTLLYEWAMEQKRRTVARIHHTQLLQLAKTKALNVKAPETREEKQMRIKLRQLARVKQICNENFAHVSAKKIKFEKAQPFQTWKVLDHDQQHTNLLPTSLENDENIVTRLKELFHKASESTYVALDCTLAIVDLDAEEKELHHKLRTSKNGKDLFTQELIRGVQRKIEIFQHKLDRENWLHEQYHALLRAQCNLFNARHTIEKIDTGLSGIPKHSDRVLKRERAEKDIAVCELHVIKINAAVQQNESEASEGEEQKMRIELERLRIARIQENERKEKEVELMKKRQLEKLEKERYARLAAKDKEKRKEEARKEKKLMRERKQQEKIRQKEMQERERVKQVEARKQLEMERKRIEQVRREDHLMKIHDDGVRALQRIQEHKNAKEMAKKTIDYVLSRVNNSIERIEKDKREQKKQEVLHRKKMIRECKFWSEEYDDHGVLYYLNYRTNKKLFGGVEPECWIFVRQWEAEKASVEYGQTNNGEGYEGRSEYTEYYDEGSGFPYWYSEETGETVWEDPTSQAVGESYEQTWEEEGYDY
jgi:hypothetical protein